MGVITISRQFGCAADEIAAKVAEALGYEVVDKELLAHVAAEAQASEEEVAKYDEASLSPIERFLRALVKFATPEEALTWSPDLSRKPHSGCQQGSNGSVKAERSWTMKSVSSSPKWLSKNWLRRDGSSSSVVAGWWC